ncbi:hypothetical protein FACS189452_09480 [Bacteroidia bacterium]|nr:hypothetical protein FACS189452_09480 [Bacteroidia bacterium]GHT83454.1 hypothetical protein FACS189467_8920 [Bacteroidia bacterium]
MNYGLLQVQPALNATQLHLVEMFSFNKQESNLTELKSVLLDFYRKKVDEEAELLWKSKNLSNAKMEEMLYAHNRIPYQ